MMSQDIRMLEIIADTTKKILAIVLSGFLLTFASCGGSGGMNSFLTPDNEVRKSNSLYGNYLAGRFAGSIRDTKNAAAFYERALERDPNNTVIMERAFLLMVADGQITDSVDLAQKIMKKDDGNRLARLVLGLEAFRQGKYDSVRSQLSQSQSNPIIELVRKLIISWSYAAVDNIPAAVQMMDEAKAGSREVKADSRLASFYVANRAFINDFAENTDAAAADYLEAMRMTDGHSFRVVQAYGEFLRGAGRQADARQVYEDYLQLSPEHVIIKAELEQLETGEAADQLFDSPKAGVANAIYGPASYLAQDRARDLSIIYLQLALHIDPDFAIAHILLADLFKFNRRWEDAVQAYAQIPSSSVFYRNAQVQIAMNLDRLERSDEAVSILRQIVRRDEDDLEGLVALANMLRTHDRFEEAAEVYDRAVDIIGSISDEHWSLFYARGVALERSKRWTEAERDFLKSLSLSPNQPITLNYLGYSWVDQNINMDEAMRLIKKAVQLSPDDGYIVDSLGWAYYKRGDYERAVGKLERAVELQPDDPVINEHLGDAYWKVGRNIEARFQWRHALSLEPLEENVPAIEQKLQHGVGLPSQTDASLSSAE